jgi:glycine cleavage system H lipoate-binding protein
MATDPPADAAGDLYFHPGHTWVRVSQDGLVSVGMSDFASNFAGSPRKVALPERGDRLRQGEPAWTVSSKGERELTQVMPVDGTVLAVNKDLHRDPDLVQQSPYGKGWILCAKPRHLPDALANLMHGTTAAAWMDSSRQTLLAHLATAMGTVAHDGGEWAAGFGDRLEDADWETVKREMFPPAEPPRGR